MRTPFKILRLQAEAFRRHGLPLELFLKVTPAELASLNADALREWTLEKELEDKRTARLIAAIYNNNPGKKKGRTFSEKDFMPKKASQVSKGVSASNLLAKVRWIHNQIHVTRKDSPHGS